MFFNYVQPDFRYIILFFYRKLRFDVKFQSFLIKPVLFNDTTGYFRYKIIFYSIENLVFDVKFQFFLVKTIFFNYANGFEIHNTILSYRKPRFRCKISILPCKNVFFDYTTGFSIHNTIFFIEKLVLM